MKAIHVHEFGGPEVLRLEEVLTPQPGPGEVFVRMHAAGVNPVETYIRAGTYARLPELPYTPGNDGAGVVEHVGSGVRSSSPAIVFIPRDHQRNVCGVRVVQKRASASVAGKCFVRARRSHGDAVRDGVSRLVAARRCEAR